MRTQRMVVAAFLGMVLLLLLWQVEAGMARTETSAESRAVTTSGIHEGKEYQPSYELAWQVEGGSPLLRAMVEEELTRELIRLGFALHPADTEGVPYLLVLLDSSRRALPFVSRATAEMTWAYDNYGEREGLMAQVMALTGPEPRRRGQGEMVIKSRTVGLFTTSYHNRVVARQVAADMAKQLHGAVK